MQNDHLPSRIADLRCIASALRDLPNEPKNEMYLLAQAGRYFYKAMELGAFSDSKWIRLRTDAEQWEEDISFVQASSWFLENGKSLGIGVDNSKANGDLTYWAPLVATLIDEAAETLHKIYEAELEAARKAPKNRWQQVNHWWQHNLYATAVVVLVGSISAIGGIISFIKTVMMLFANK